MTWNVKVPEGMTLEERNYRIFDKVFNGESPTDVAKEFGISPSRVHQIYKKMWKEHCSMPSSEKIITNIGKDRFIKIGHEQYEGYFTKKNGKVIKKRFEGDNAKDEWLAWREEQLENLESRGLPHGDMTTKVEPVVEEPPKTTNESTEIYMLRASDKHLSRPQEPVLFRDLDKALYISEMMTRITGVETEVVEYFEPEFWDKEY